MGGGGGLPGSSKNITALIEDNITCTKFYDSILSQSEIMEQGSTSLLLPPSWVCQNKPVLVGLKIIIIYIFYLKLIKV